MKADFERCDNCGSSRIAVDDWHRLSCCIDCGAYKTADGWRKLAVEEMKTLPTFPSKIARDISERDAESWWSSRSPQERYHGIGYSGWSDDNILRVFGGDWNQLPEDVRNDLVLGMKRGNYVKL